MNRVSVNVERLVRLQRKVEEAHNRAITDPRYTRARLAEVREEIDTIILEEQGEKPKTDLEHPETGEGRY